jgi:hypothetical protein
MKKAGGSDKMSSAIMACGTRMQPGKGRAIFQGPQQQHSHSNVGLIGVDVQTQPRNSCNLSLHN